MRLVDYFGPEPVELARLVAVGRDAPPARLRAWPLAPNRPARARPGPRRAAAAHVSAHRRRAGPGAAERAGAALRRRLVPVRPHLLGDQQDSLARGRAPAPAAAAVRGRRGRTQAPGAGQRDAAHAPDPPARALLQGPQGPPRHAVHWADTVLLGPRTGRGRLRRRQPRRLDAPLPRHRAPGDRDDGPTTASHERAAILLAAMAGRPPCRRTPATGSPWRSARRCSSATGCRPRPRRGPRTGSGRSTTPGAAPPATAAAEAPAVPRREGRIAMAGWCCACRTDPAYGRQLQTGAVHGQAAEGRVLAATRMCRSRWATGRPWSSAASLGSDAADGPRRRTCRPGLRLRCAASACSRRSRKRPWRPCRSRRPRRRRHPRPPRRRALRVARGAARTSASRWPRRCCSTWACPPRFEPSPAGDCTPAQTGCRALPHGDREGTPGVEIGDEILDALVAYLAALPPPKQGPQPEGGRGCSPPCRLRRLPRPRRCRWSWRKAGGPRSRPTPTCSCTTWAGARGRGCRGRPGREAVAHGAALGPGRRARGGGDGAAPRRPRPRRAGGDPVARRRGRGGPRALPRAGRRRPRGTRSRS